MKKMIGLLMLSLLIPSFALAIDSSISPTGVIRYDKEKASPGYILTYPSTSGNKSVFLMDLEGNLVHKWKTNYQPSTYAQFHPDGYVVTNAKPLSNDESPVLFGGFGGIFEAFDWDGTKLWELKHISKDEIQHHGFTITETGNIMYVIWERFSYEDMIKAGRDPNSVPKEPMQMKNRYGEKVMDSFWIDGIVEWDPKTKKEVWRWSVKDNLGVGKDKIDPNYYLPMVEGKINPNMHLDWLHANAVSENKKDGLVYLDLRHQQGFITIDKKSGKIVDRWGNPAAYKEGREPGYRDNGDVRVFEPHDINYVGNGKALYFDNGFGRPNFNGSGVLLIDLESGKVDWEYKANHPSSFYSARQSGTQMLPNGNVQITSTESGRIFEVTPEKKIVWEYIDPVVKILEDGTMETICLIEDDNYSYPGAFHRAFRYEAEHPGLNGRDLSPKSKMSPNCPDFYKMYSKSEYIAK